MQRSTFFLQLAGYAIEVRWVAGLMLSTDAVGQWDGTTRSIELDLGLDSVEAKEVLMHECIHAVEDLYELDLSETQVRILSLGLHQVLAPLLTSVTL